MKTTPWIAPLMQMLTLSVFLGIVLLLFITPNANSYIWTFVIPLVPITLLVLGFNRWREICPLAWFSKRGQSLTWSRKRRLPVWFEHNVYGLQFSLLFVAFSARLYVLNHDALLLALFFILVVSLALASGLFLSGKTWCNYLCPVGVVEKIYTGSSAHMHQYNAPCSSCTACKNNCPDIDAESSYWKEQNSRQKRLVFYAFPGLVFGFYFYYYLETGSWVDYFNGTWAHAQAGQTLLNELSRPGFFFLQEIPKVVAVLMTLAVSSVVSYYIFHALEAFISKTRYAAKKDEHAIAHITNIIAGFIAFNIFYIFAGAPTFAMYPIFYSGLHFLVVLISAVLLYKELFREEKFFIQERFARKILKRWQGKEVPSENLKEIYYTYAHQQKNHEERLSNYKETILELLSDGILTQEGMKLLDKMRDQLGISALEHSKIIKSLEKEHAQLFNANSELTSEKIYQLNNYKKHLKKLLQENPSVSQEELNTLRRHLQIEVAEHERILNELIHSDDLLKERLREALHDLMSLYKMSSFLPNGQSVEVDYLKYCITNEIQSDTIHLRKMVALVFSEEETQKLMDVLSMQNGAQSDISWLNNGCKPIVEVILEHQRKVNMHAYDDLHEVVQTVFENDFDALVAPLLLVLHAQELTHEYIQKIKEYEHSPLSTVAEIAQMILSKNNTITTVQKEALIRGVPLFSTLAQFHIEMLAQKIDIKRFEKDAYIVRQGNEAKTLHILYKGSAKVVVNTKKDIVHVAIVKKNDYIGEIALLSGAKRTASVIALEETQTLALSVEVLKEIINYSPTISFDIMREMTVRLLELQQHYKAG